MDRKDKLYEEGKAERDILKKQLAELQKEVEQLRSRRPGAKRVSINKQYTLMYRVPPITSPNIQQRDLSNLGTNSRFFDREFLVRAKVNNSNEQNTVVHLMKRCQGGKLESIENVTKLASYFPIHHPANWRSLQDAKERRHKTCALVGNSGSLNGSFHGAAIDKHEAVIRINNAPTINFSEHVGSITSYRIVNNLAFQHRPEGQEILIPLSSICPSDLALIRKQAIWFLERQPKSYSTAYNTMKIDGHPYHMYFKSSGVDSVYLALHLCERTDVYGMTIDMETGGYRHYYDKRLAAGHTVIQNILLYRFIEAFLPDRIQFN
ncbi:hypothetical protein M9434_007198 [Picochlorum sp. BPE23]|nr:hypothetical protein M9434_007198 [Picochlorum sp. BPE23]